MDWTVKALKSEMDWTVKALKSEMDWTVKTLKSEMDWTVKALKSECHNPQQQRKHVKLCTLGLKRWVPSAALDSGQRTP